MALACELPATRGLALSRLSCADIAREAQRTGLIATVSGTTVWRWLSEDAIRPGQHRAWIFPRDPAFARKAGRILALYAGEWDGHSLHAEASLSHTEGRSRLSWEWESAGVRTHPCQLLRVAHLLSMRRFASSAARSDGPDRPHLLHAHGLKLLCAIGVPGETDPYWSGPSGPPPAGNGR